MPQKLMFLYLKTGGGHLSPARSVAHWIGKNRGAGVEVLLVDGFENAPGIVKKVVEDGYRKSQDKARWVFEGIYAFNKVKPFARLSRWLVSYFVTPRLLERIASENPDKIVIFHFFLIGPVKRALRQMGLSIPVQVVVTDPFTAHPIWFLDPDQNFIVFSQQLRNHLITRHGIAPERITEFPFIIDERFTSRMSDKRKELIKMALGIGFNRRVILIMGGADGIPRGKKIVEAILKSGIEADIVAVCGRNKSLQAAIAQLKTKHQAANLHVHGFVDYVYELLSISDLVITKCGASTFMEVLHCGKIPLINSYLWEQEKGNVEFICSNRIGLYEKRVHRIPSVISDIIDNTSIYHENLQRLRLHNGTPLVARHILNL